MSPRAQAPPAAHVSVGITAALAAEAADVPTELVAVTVNV
jgi:hypothetical protein